jgi:hypothetical protein
MPDTDDSGDASSAEPEVEEDEQAEPEVEEGEQKDSSDFEAEDPDVLEPEEFIETEDAETGE